MGIIDSGVVLVGCPPFQWLIPVGASNQLGDVRIDHLDAPIVRRYDYDSYKHQKASDAETMFFLCVRMAAVKKQHICLHV